MYRCISLVDKKKRKVKPKKTKLGKPKIVRRKVKPIEDKSAPSKKPKVKADDEVEVGTKIDEVRASLGRLGSTKRRMGSGVPKPIFKHASDKEQKCFAIGGVLSDTIREMTGQTYALAGTGYRPDGSLVERGKGSSWEELYTQLLMYLATAEGLGCTYQGGFANLLGKKSQTEASAGLLDELTNDLRRMTLDVSAFGPRHEETLSRIDGDIRDTALQVQLANMQWEVGNYDRIRKRRNRYDKLDESDKAKIKDLTLRLNKVVGEDAKKRVLSGDAVTQHVTVGKGEDAKVKEVTHKAFTKKERTVFFYPPTKAERRDLRRLIGIREEKSKQIDTLIGERKTLLNKPRVRSQLPLREMADKVAAGLDVVSGEIFGDLHEEKKALRSMLAQALSIYSSERRLDSDEASAILREEREEFAKILEILGRLRLARESSEIESMKTHMEEKKDKRPKAETFAKEVLEGLSVDLADAAQEEKWKQVFEGTLYDILNEYNAEMDEVKASKMLSQLKAYSQMYSMLYGPKPDEVADVGDLVTIVPALSEKEITERRLREDLSVEEKPKAPAGIKLRRKPKSRD